MDSSLQNTNLQKIQTASLAIIATILASATLYYTRGIMVPFVLSIFLAVCIAPIVTWMKTTLKIPKGLALILTATLIFCIGVGGILIITTSVRNMVGKVEFYHQQFTLVSSQVIRYFSAVPILSDHINEEVILREIKQLPIFDFVRIFTGSIFSFLSATTLVAIILLFMLTGQESGISRNSIFVEFEKKVRRYIYIKTVISIVTGLLVGVFFWIQGLDMALAFALLVFFLNYIPTVGAIIATLAPLPVALIQFGPSAPFFLAILVPGGIQFLIGSVLEPKLYGKELDLHPVAILLGLLFWGMIWGIVGAVLAMPILVAIKIFLLQSRETETIGHWLGGRFESTKNGG